MEARRNRVKTCFRKTLIETLEAVIGTRKFHSPKVRFTKAHEREELLCMFADYSGEWLSGPMFTAEFRPDEIEALRRFVAIALSANHRDAAWKGFQSHATKLLAFLSRPRKRVATRPRPKGRTKPDPSPPLL